MTNKEPRYNPQPDGILEQRVGNVRYRVNVFFNQNTKTTLQDKLLKIIVMNETTETLK